MTIGSTATGKQGGAVVNALVKANKSSNEQKYTILALTRNKDSPAAQSLTNLPNGPFDLSLGLA